MFNDNNHYEEVYNKNYIILKNKDSNYLINLFLNSKNTFLKRIAFEIIIDEKRLEDCYDKEQIELFIPYLSRYELWYYKSSDNRILANIAANRLIIDMNEEFVQYNRDLIHIVK